MKNLRSILLSAFFVMLTVVVFAQVVPLDPAVTQQFDVFSYILSLIPLKYQAPVFAVITVLWISSEILGSTTKIKANNNFQLVKGWINSFFTASKNKK